MNEFSTYEFTVTQKLEGKWLWRRIALIALYIAYVGAGLALILNTPLIPLFALVPVTLWILIFFTWRFTHVDYEYSITSGELTLCRIYGNRTRRTVLQLHLRDAVRIAPLDNAEHSQKAAEWHPECEYTAVSTMNAPDIYYILFEQKEQRRGKNGRAVLYIEATQKALQICRFYNPSATVMTKTSR